MSIRFRRSIKIFPGVKLNIGKNSISTSVGVRGTHVTFGKNGTYVGTGIPGTGLSQRTKIGEPHQSNSTEVSDHTAHPSDVVVPPEKHYKIGVLFWFIVGTLVLAALQLPQALGYFWLFLLGYVIVQFVVRKVRTYNTSSK